MRIGPRPGRRSSGSRVRPAAGGWWSASSHTRPLSGQTVEVEDDTIRGRQAVAFIPEDTGVAVQLTLDYRVRRRTPFTPLVDILFIRGAFKRSLAATLEHFGVELQGARAADVG